MRMDRLANVYSVRTHLDGKCNFTNHVARVGSHNATTQNFAVTVSLWRVVE